MPISQRMSGALAGSPILLALAYDAGAGIPGRAINHVMPIAINDTWNPSQVRTVRDVDAVADSIVINKFDVTLRARGFFRGTGFQPVFSPKARVGNPCHPKIHTLCAPGAVLRS